MARLVRSGIKESEAASDIRQLGYAFSFGTFSVEGEARRMLDKLVAQGVPGYMVPANSVGGSQPAFHVYAGAYESADESWPLRDSLRRAGLSAELVERTGLVRQ